MKRLALAVIGLGVLVAVGFALTRPATPKLPAAETIVESPSDTAVLEKVEPRQFPTTSAVAEKEPKPNTEEASAIPPVVTAAPPKAVGAKLVFDQAMETVASTQTSYHQKQKAWKQLKETGKLDEAIGGLEQQVASEPQRPELVSALGQAYYKKAGQTADVREQAILAMKADQTLEAALNLDPSNWDARFTKAVGMSYWPPELNKTTEMFEEFQRLIKQQESEPQRPEFTRTYERLGEEYQKAGYPQYALDVWKRGAALFPGDEDLRNKLAEAAQSK